MEQKDLILDFNLYLCEKFGYRNSCSVMQNANGFCVNIRERDLDCYIRFWEYSDGRGNFPDWSIIIVRSNFKKNQAESLKDLARFFKEYMPRYGYKYLCTEGDDYKYYQTLTFGTEIFVTVAWHVLLEETSQVFQAFGLVLLEAVSYTHLTLPTT